MSRLSKEEYRENPAKRTIQFKSEKGFVYYDKDTKENVEIPYPFRFVVLEKDYCSYNGFSEDKNQGMYSNEVKNPTDIVTVKCGNEILATFQKQDWNPKDKSKVAYKDTPELKGCKYTQILYIATKLEGDTKEEIYRLMLNGAALSGGITIDKKTNKEHEGQEKDGWIRTLSSLRDRNAAYKYSFSVSSTKEKKNGAVKFNVPVFEADLMEMEEGDNYTEMAQQVEEWFSWYSNQKPSEKQPALESFQQESFLD